MATTTSQISGLFCCFFVVLSSFLLLPFLPAATRRLYRGRITSSPARKTSEVLAAKMVLLSHFTSPYPFCLTMKKSHYYVQLLKISLLAIERIIRWNNGKYILSAYVGIDSITANNAMCAFAYDAVNTGGPFFKEFTGIDRCRRGSAETSPHTHIVWQIAPLVTGYRSGSTASSPCIRPRPVRNRQEP